MATELTQARLKELLHYCPETGVFTRLTSRKGATHSDRAGAARPDGYRHLCIDYRLYQEHRLAWFYVHGVWPDRQLDHINGNRADNRIANLRDVSNVENAHNKRPTAANKTGVLGVFFDKRAGRYKAQLTAGGKKRNLGSFATIEEAAAARKAAELLYHPSKPQLHAG